MSIGYLMNDSIKDWYYDSAYPFRVQNDLGEQAFDVFELFHDIEIDDPQPMDVLHQRQMMENIILNMAIRDRQYDIYHSNYRDGRESVSVL